VQFDIADAIITCRAMQRGLRGAGCKGVWWWSKMACIGGI